MYHSYKPSETFRFRDITKDCSGEWGQHLLHDKFDMSSSVLELGLSEYDPQGEGCTPGLHAFLWLRVPPDLHWANVENEDRALAIDLLGFLGQERTYNVEDVFVGHGDLPQEFRSEASYSMPVMLSDDETAALEDAIGGSHMRKRPYPEGSTDGLMVRRAKDVMGSVCARLPDLLDRQALLQALGVSAAYDAPAVSAD